MNGTVLSTLGIILFSTAIGVFFVKTVSELLEIFFLSPKENSGGETTYKKVENSPNS